MNLTAMKKRLYIIASVLAAITACSEKNELSTPLELGVKQQEVTLPCTAGSYYVEVLADGEFTLSLPSDATWLSIGGERSISGHGDSRIELHLPHSDSGEVKFNLSLHKGRNLIVLGNDTELIPAVIDCISIW